MENIKLLVEMAESLAKTRQQKLVRLDIQYSRNNNEYVAYCYINDYEYCYKIRENLTIEIL